MFNVTPFHIKWAPDRRTPVEPEPPSPELAKFQRLLRDLFQFDCADLDFGIYRIMDHKREVVDRYIDEELPAAIEKAVGEGAIVTEAERADNFKKTREEAIMAFGEDAIAPNGELVRYQETPLGKRYILWWERARQSESVADVRRDIYNHLHAFFRRYYQDGDFVPERRYSWENPYVIPYNGEEIHFHWANRDQYYVKAAEHFTDYRYRTRSGVSVRFWVRAATVEQNDVKGKTRYHFPVLDAAVWDEERRELEVPFDHRLPTAAELSDLKKNGQQRTILELAEASVREKLATTPEAAKALLDPWDGHTGDDDAPALFTHHARYFTCKRTSDFFIHRDLRAFLVRELDYYIRSEVLALRSLVAGGEARADAWLDKVRIIREVGANVTEFLAQIEGFQKMLWEKRKFAVDVQYCVAVRLLPGRLVSQVVACDAQWAEWRELGCLLEDDIRSGSDDGLVVRREFLDHNPGLLIDTRHFEPEFVDDLLAAIDDIDEKTDGLAVHSENWQALNLLGERYKGQVGCTYIDPPYNTGSDGFVYKDQYQRSSWAAMIHQAVARSRGCSSDRSAIFVSIDEGEHAALRFLLDSCWGRRNHVADIVWAAGRKNDSRFVSVSHEYILIYARDHDYLRSQKVQWRLEKQGLADIYAAYARLRRKHREDYRAMTASLKRWFRDLPDSHPAKAHRHYSHADQRGVYFPDNIAWPGRGGPRYEVLHPRTGKPVKVPVAGWRLTEEEMRRRIGKGLIHFGEDEHTVPKRKSYLREHEDQVPYSVFYRDGRGATNRLRNILGTQSVEYPKDETVIARCVEMGAPRDSTVLDYFAGSGTTGHAVVNLNREDGGRRKFILVEMGDHFDTVLMPRLKKVAFSPEWKNGRAVREATPEEAERGPRIIKYFRLESYEDALSNIEFEEPDGDLFSVEDYMLRYMLRWETKGSATLLNVTALERPFDYTLRLNGNGDGDEEVVDVQETFNYLLGLAVRTRRVHDDDGRRYLVYTGRTRDGRESVVIWRNTDGWTLEDRERDRDFVAARNMTAGADDIWMNGDTMVEGARPLDSLFKKRMFASVTD